MARKEGNESNRFHSRAHAHIKDQIKFHLQGLKHEANKFISSQIAERMNKLSTQKPETFEEAAQLVYSFHCCLHLIGEPTSVGRLDQLLMPFSNGTTPEKAQEVIDCFWLKLGEPVNLNNRLLNDQGTWGMCAVPFASTGMFPNGDTINQWVQQVKEFILVANYNS